MSYQTLLYEKYDGKVALITLNRPHRLNAISQQMQKDLNQVLDEIESDGEVNIFVLTGAPRPDGRPAFCAGADLRENAERRQGAVPRETPNRLARAILESTPASGVAAVCRRIEALAKPSIGAVDGVCTAGGIELALACDIRVVSETAEISDLHIKNLGSLGGAGVTVRLPRTVGRAWAKEIMFSADVFNGRDAVAMGFANHVYAPNKLVEGALGLARKIARMRPEAVALAKAIINQSVDMDIERALRFSYIGAPALPGQGGDWRG